MNKKDNKRGINAVLILIQVIKTYTMMQSCEKEQIIKSCSVRIVVWNSTTWRRNSE